MTDSWLMLRKPQQPQICLIIYATIATLLEVEAFDWIVDSNTSYAFAIQKITAGDTITLRAGIYSGEESCDKIILVSNITIKASFDASVIIDCKKASRHIKISGEHVQLQGISFTNGFSRASGGCLAINGANTVIENCTFENCNTSGFGGGLILDINTKIKHVKILKCSAVRGGAIFVNTSARLLLSGDFVLRENTATSNGGAIYLDTLSSAIINAQNGEMNGNTARLSGGAIHSGKADVTLSGNVSFLNNTVTFPTLSSAGGAFYGIASLVTVTSGSSVFFLDNSCVYGGGALALYSGSRVQIDGNVQFRGW